MPRASRWPALWGGAGGPDFTLHTHWNWGLLAWVSCIPAAIGVHPHGRPRAPTAMGVHPHGRPRAPTAMGVHPYGRPCAPTAMGVHPAWAPRDVAGWSLLGPKEAGEPGRARL